MSKEGILFLTGSCAYPTLEMLWRGRTHYSMALAGGVCMVLIEKICCEKLKNKSLAVRCLAGSGIITGVELGTGLIVNDVMHLHVWDYSKLPMNVLGQICLPYSLLWFGLTLPAMALCKVIERVEVG